MLTRGPIGIVIAVIFVPLVYVVYLAIIRIFFELLMVVFRIGEDVRVIAERAQQPGA